MGTLELGERGNTQALQGASSLPVCWAHLVQVLIVLLDHYLQELHEPLVEGLEPMQGGVGQVCKDGEEVPASAGFLLTLPHTQEIEVFLSGNTEGPRSQD